MRGQLTEVQRLRQANSRLTNENHRLRERVKVLEAKVVEQDKLIETITLQLEQLKTIVFGKKKLPHNDKPESSGSAISNQGAVPGKRTNESYRRHVPGSDEVTSQQQYAIDSCPDCSSPLTNVRTIIRYLEDILLPQKKTCQRQEIMTGWCQNCHKQCQAIAIPAQGVTLGPNVSTAVLYGTYILRLSFAQVINWLNDCYHLKLSQGEIAHILQAASRKLDLPYEQLKAGIRGSPGVHMDESTYKQQGGDSYVWVMTPTNGEEAVFVVGKHRGKANAVELLGQDFRGTRITDCYTGYKNLVGTHQVCWAHLFRYARELTDNASLPEDKRPMCQKFYQQIFAQLKRIATITEEEALSAPKKLIDLKQRITTYQAQFLTCITTPGIPPDNNKAERKIRHLVLKRKVSFGTRSAKGSKAFSINASVLLSWWWTDRTSWFVNVSKTLGT